MNDKKTRFFGVNKTDSLIDDIFSCIAPYDALIDIGAVFINYTNETFKNRYKEILKRKKYFIYFENSIKIYNLDNNTYELKSSIDITKRYAFYYFSNKNITGVDVKDIMNINARGLVTITNKTIIRDFSQGIFRLRNILDGLQRIDIIINKLMVEKDNTIIVGGCNMEYPDINRDNLFKVLKYNQKKLDEDKHNLLIKQNIIALLKKKGIDYNNNLYIDPSILNDNHIKYMEKIQELGNLEDSYKNFNYNNINDHNILYYMYRYSLEKLEIPDLLKILINDYFTKNKMMTIQTNKTLNVEENVEEKVQETENISITINISKQSYLDKISDDFIITNNLYINDNPDKDRIIFCSDMNNINCSNILFILYDKIYNNIYIFDNMAFDYYLLYNNMDNLNDNYILISLVNNISYGDENIVNQIIIIKIIIIKLINDMILVNIKKYTDPKLLNLYKLSSKQELFISEHSEDIDNFNKKFNYYYNNFKYSDLKGGFIKYKYLKYKYKYLMLNNKINKFNKF